MVVGKEFSVLKQNVEVREECYRFNVVGGIVPNVELVADLCPVGNVLGDRLFAARHSVNILAGAKRMREAAFNSAEADDDVVSGRCFADASGVVISEGIEYIEDTTGIMTKRIKPNFKTLGPRYGKQMKQISALVAAFSQNDIAQLERSEKWSAEIDGVLVEATIEDFEIQTEDIPGWLVASEGKLTVALDITITEELKREGIARELVNRIQNIRKESGFEVTDKITVEIERHEMLEGAIADYGTYIAQQTLAHNVALVDAVQNPVAIEIDETQINIEVRKSDM